MRTLKKVACLWCGRTIPRQWHFRFITPRCGPERYQVERCAEIAAAMASEPPPERDLDLPPDDIDICPYCTGNGEVFLRQDWATGAYITGECQPCGATGKVDPSWLAHVQA